MNARLFFKKVFRTLLVVGITTILLSATNALAASGTLDPTFGTNGVVTTKFNGMPSSTRDIILQPDGKIVVLGNMQSTKVIARYNNNGTPDTSFGTNGITPIDFSSFFVKKLALQPDGKLIVAGQQRGFAAVRYNSNGTLDTSFGTNGLAALESVNPSTDISYYVEDVAIQPDGKIVMAGSYSIGNHIEIEVVRFNSDGTRDAIESMDWGTFGSQYNYGKAVTIQPDNKIIVSGDMVSCCDTYQYISLARLDPNVLLDRSTFGSGRGAVTARLNRFKHGSGALALQPDGRIVLAGTILGTDWKTPQNLALARFNSDGSQDTTFGGTGIVVTDFGAEESTANLVIQASGKIIVAGTTSSAGSSDFLLVRYNSDGSLDTSFGTNGKLTTDFGNSAESVSGIVQQPDGKVIVSGTSGDNAVLARYDTGVSGITNIVSFKSVGAYDGWILESGENSNQGGTLDKISNVFFVGDDAKDRQYRGILSFDTNSIPDNAAITSAQVKINKQGVVGTDPFNTHGNLLLEIRNGTFRNDIALTLEDFSIIANIGSTQDKFSAADAGWYTASLSNINLGLVNKVGDTQFRLLFSKDDNDNMGADYVKFFSGNSTTDLPQLVVTYSTTTTPNQAPVINGGASLSISIPENTVTVMGVTAMDPDGQPITYSISGPDAGKFSISPSTGILTFLTAPDMETIPSGTVYHVTAQASDGILTASQDVSVTVTGVNEFAPVITSNGGGAVANISLPENTTIVTTITATDADLPTQSLEFRDAGGADDLPYLFSINESDGTLSFVTPPSYNEPNDSDLDHVYHITVIAYDGEFATSQELVITITNSNIPTNEMLDPTFGTNGIVTTKFNGMPSSAGEVVLQPDGKIITLGSGKLNGDQSTKIITRYNSNGTVDTSFGMNGSTPIEVELFSGSKIALQPDGKLIVGGKNWNDYFAVVRYNSNGTLDTSFGTNGMGVYDWGASDMYQNFADIAIQPDGKIVVVGDLSAGWANYTDFSFARFNSDGTKDIGNNMIGFPHSRFNYGRAVVIQPDNRIVISGNMTDTDGGGPYLSLVRLNQDGSLDKATFGTNGTAEIPVFDFDNNHCALALQADGKFVMAGTATIGINGNLSVVRLNSNGALDTTFGGTGVVITDFGADESINDLVIQPDGKIILGGKTHSLDPNDIVSRSDFLLARYNSDGSLDTTFGANGKVVTDFGDNTESARSIVMQPDGKVVVVGASGENGILARYNTGTFGPETSLTFNSVGANDGWILELGENTNKGGTLEKTSNIINVGDDAKDRQYRGILSFDTTSIPDNAVITSAQVKVKRQSYVGTIPFKTHGNLLLEIRNGMFNNDIALTVEDFSAIANIGATQDNFSGADANWIHTATLSNVNLGLINKVGVTQFRLLFSVDDNDDLDADYIKLFSGNAASDLPQLVVTYSTASGTGNQAPVINGGAAISISIPENTTIVTAVTAVDPEGQPITYSISGLDAGKFSINPSTGLLTFVTAPDMEAIPSGTVYHLTAQAADGTLTASQDISVTVTGVNELAPVITSNGGGVVANISLPENTMDVTTITAIDADLPTQSLKYWTAGGADELLFNLNWRDGKLSFITAPSYNAPNDAGSDHVYNITVMATDGTLNVTQELVISIINPNASTNEMLDPTFGTNGIVTTKFNGLPSSARDIVLQVDGKIVVLGDMQSTRVVARYNSNGVLDTSFGSNGIVPNGIPSFSGKTLALQPDGKLIVGGLSMGGFAVVRYNSNGTLDTSFGTNGMGALDTDADHLYSAEDVTVQPDGKIVLVGDYQFRYGNHIEFEIVRFNSDGTQDAIDTIYLPSRQFDYGKAVVIQPDHKIVMSGYMQGYDGDYYIPLARLNPDFSLDKSAFGSGTGTAITPLDYFKSSNGALALQPDGKIVVVGTIFNMDMDIPQNLVLARFNSDGSLDASFGGTGIVVTDFGAEESTANLVIQASGKIILAGTTTNLGSSDFLLARYNSDGSLDTTFGANGKVTTDLGNSTDATTGIIQQPDGKVIVSGTSGDNAVLARYDTSVSSTTNSTGFTSVGAYDGWILESGENTNQGGTLDKISNVFFVGDDAKDRQYRAILSFNTDSLPDDATITSAQVKIKKQGVVGTDPFNTHGNLLLEIRNGAFSNSDGLNVEDFSITANIGSTQDKFSVSEAGWYAASLSNINLGLVNKVGPTQFRLLFSKDDNDDMGADYLKFFSGNSASDLPQLILTYSTTSGSASSMREYSLLSSMEGTAKQPPTITTDGGSAAASFSVQENASAVTTITGVDPNLSTQPLTYSITGGTDSSRFIVDPSTGVLSFISAPDFEVPTDDGLDNIYNVTVQVSDGSLTATQDITIIVTNLNENAPVFVSANGFNVPENTSAVATVTASDADNPAQPLTYSITGGVDSALFNLNPSTGELTFIAAPDYEVPADVGLDNIYNITIQASNGILAVTQDVVVTVTSVSDNSPVITSNAAISISENTTIVTTVTATDADLPIQPLTFLISGGADSAFFNINSSTGELTFIGAPNYEIPADAGSDNTYNMTIQVSDGVVAVTQDVTVMVTSVNDNNPIVTSNSAISIPENTLAVATLTTTDADLPTQPLTYSIIGGADSARFNINPSTGELNFITAPDFELPTDTGMDNIYNVTVQVSDGELVGTQDIFIMVNAINDNTPVITSAGNFSIPENNIVVATVTATDADLPTQPLTYSIGGGPDSTLFGINPYTGELTFIAAPDYEMQKDAGMDNIYNVTVQASDGAWAVTQDLSVTVTPVNDNIPVITSPTSFSIAENITAVIVITATDADLPAQALTYSILGGADSALLTINTSTGALDFITGRDYEMPGDAGSDNIYNVTIQASDGALNVTQDIALSIASVNDNTPVIASQNYYSIPENTNSIATIIATDTDRPTQPLTYSISGGVDAVKFSIVNDTGVLTLITAPDFETPADFNLDNIYEVVVQVSDGTYNSTQYISVQVANVANLFPFESTP